MRTNDFTGYYKSENNINRETYNKNNLLRTNSIISNSRKKSTDKQKDPVSNQEGDWSFIDNIQEDHESSISTKRGMDTSKVYYDSEETMNTVQETKKDISDDLKTLLTMFDSAGIKVRVTSGYREGAKTKQGDQSHHSTGNAIDIVPENGDFTALANTIRSNPEISTFMKSKGLGVLDETTTEMLSKTGGTGAHFHIGPDSIAQNFWKV